MKSDTETQRVETIDIDLDTDRRGIAGAASSRAPGDWAGPAINEVLRRRRRKADDTEYVRVEYVGPDPDYLDLICPDEDGVVRVRISKPVDGESLIVQSVEFRPANGAISARKLRKLGLGAVLETVNDTLQLDPTIAALGDGGWRRRVKRPGRAGHPDLHYAEWAQRYVSALRARPTSPVRHLVDELCKSGEFATEAQVRATMTKVRNKGMLTDPPAAGKPGGELTPLATKLLSGRVTS